MPRCSVSVIGQPEERKATLAAMGRAMPFVRHELGKRLRLKRIPEFHLELDDTRRAGDAGPPAAQRAGGGPRAGGRAAGRRVAADAGRPAPPRGRRGRGAGPGGRGRRRSRAAKRRTPAVRPARRPQRQPRKRQPVIDLSPWTPAVPDAVVERIAAARRVLAVGHENPDADTIGSTLAVCRLVAACGGRANAGLRRPGAAAVRVPARHRDRPDGPRARRRLRPARRVGLRDASTASARSPAATRSCSRGCRGSSSTITPRTARPARPTGSTRRPPRPAR